MTVRELVIDESAVWPTFRGPLVNGVVDDGELPTAWSETEGVVWSVDVPGRGHGSPVVVGDTIVLASADDAQEQQYVIAYDRATGKQKWLEIIHEGGFPSAREVHQKGTNANSTLATDGQLAYIAFFNAGKVFATALDLKGNQVWQRELGDFASKFGYAPSPILYKSFVIVAADNLGGGYLAAMDRETGAIAWRISRPTKNSHSTPVVANLDGKDQLLISGCDSVTSYDPASGDELWSTRCTSETTCGTIVVLGNRIFAGGGYPKSQTVCLDSKGAIVWENDVKIYEPSLLAVQESVFAVSDRGIAYCWDAATGKERWKKRLKDGFSASPLFCNGLIYATNLKGATYVFEADADKFNEVATNQIGNDAYASPAVADGQLFYRVGFGFGAERREKLVCIGSRVAN